MAIPVPEGFEPIQSSQDPSVPQYSNIPEGFEPIGQTEPTAADYAQLTGQKAMSGLINFAQLPGKVGAVLGVPGAQEYVSNLEQTRQQGEELVNPQLRERASLITPKGLNINPLSVGEAVVEGLPSAIPYAAAGIEGLTAKQALTTLGVIGGSQAASDAYQATLEQAQANHLSPEESRSLALKTAAVMAPVGAGAAVVGGKWAEKAAAGYTNPIAKAIAGAVGFTPPIAAQSAIESIVQDAAAGKPIDFNKAKQSAVASSVSNIATGAVLGAVHRGPKEPVENRLNTELQDTTPAQPAPIEGELNVEEAAKRLDEAKAVANTQPTPIEEPVQPPTPAETDMQREHRLKQAALDAAQAEREHNMKLAELRHQAALAELEAEKIRSQRAKEAFDRQARESIVHEEAANVKAQEELDKIKERTSQVPSEETADVVSGLARPDEEGEIRAAEIRQENERLAQAEDTARESQQDEAEAMVPKTDFEGLKFDNSDRADVKNPMPNLRLEAAAKNFFKKWFHRPDIVAFDDFFNDSRVPDHVKAEAKRQGIKDPAAFKLGNTIYLNSRKIESHVDLQRELGHEGVGHIALEVFHDSSELKNIYQSVYDARPEDAAKFNKFGYKDKEAGHPDQSKDQLTIGAEIVANIAQKNPGASIVRKAVVAIRNWMRSKGIKLKLRDMDIIENYILPAKNYMKSGIAEGRSFKDISTKQLQGTVNEGIINETGFGGTEAGIASRELARRNRASGIESTGDLAFTGRASNRELYKMREEMVRKKNYLDPHDDKGHTELDKRIQEIDDDIYDNNIEHLKTMIKGKKDLSKYKPDFQHEGSEEKPKLGLVPKKAVKEPSSSPSDLTMEEAAQFTAEPEKSVGVTAKLKPEHREAANDDPSLKFQHSVEDTGDFRKAKKRISKIGNFYRSLFSPIGMGKGEERRQGIEAASIHRALQGQARRSEHLIREKLFETSKMFDKRTDAENIKFLIDSEAGKDHGNTLLNLAAKKLEQNVKGAEQELLRGSPDDVPNYAQDFLPGIWERPDEVSKFYKRRLKEEQLKGNDNYMPTIKETLDAGHELITTNPVKLASYRIGEMHKYNLGRQWLKAMADKGIAKLVSKNEMHPLGYSPLNSIYAKTIKAAEVGREAGSWYVPDTVAQIINNHLSTGLRSKLPGFSEYMHIANFLNQAQLGLSAFHAGFTSMDTMASKLSLGLKKLATGDVAGFAKTLSEVPTAARTNYTLGKNVLEEWKVPGTHPELAEIVKAAELAGASAEDYKIYTDKFREKFINAFNRGEYKSIKGLAKLPFHAHRALIDAAAAPIMEYLVPRQKFGVFADLARFSMERSAKLGETKEQLIKRLQKDWDSVDNRLGQLVYDNLFWNKTFKEIMMGITRSVGWNLGSIREVGGGAIDLARDLRKLANGKKNFEITNKTAYFFSMFMMSAVVGSIMNKLATGEDPQDLRDAFFPRTGHKDANGNNMRVSLPFYTKDVAAMYHDPIGTLGHKSNPAINMIIEMASNKDFYGKEVVHTSDEPLVQALQLMKYAGYQVLPFGFRNAFEVSRSPESNVLEKAGSFVGFPKAPNWIEGSDAYNLSSELLNKEFSSAARSAKELERTQLVNEIHQGLNSDDPKIKEEYRQKMVEAAQKGDLLKSDLDRIKKKTASKDPLVYNITKIHNVESAMRVWRKSTPEEKKKLFPVLLRKISDSGSIGREEKLDYLKEVQEGLKNG